MIEHNELRRLLEYDPETGIFTWRVQYNSRTYPGKEAGGLDCQGYVKIQIYGVQYRRGRLAWFYMTGHWPCHEIDHKDGTKSNDAWANLREASDGQNTHNRFLPVGDSGRRGVRRVHSNLNRFEARISIGYQRVSLGMFDSVEEAHEAYLIASKTLHKEYSPYNRKEGA